MITKFLKRKKSIIGTFYTNERDILKIVAIIRNKFPKAIIDNFESNGDLSINVLLNNGLFSESTKITINYLQKIQVTPITFNERNPSPALDNFDCEVTRNLVGAINFVSAIPFSNQTLKAIFLNKIAFVNSFFSFILEGKQTKEIIELIQCIASELDAFIFANTDTFLNPTKVQRFLDHNLKTITDLEGNQEVETLSCRVAKNTEAEINTLSSERVKRKEKNEIFIKKKNIKINQSLPCIEAASDIKLRSPIEIGRRMVILMALRLVAYEKKESSEITEYLKKYKFWDDVTYKERQFLAEPTEEQKCSFSWEIESVYILMWAVKKLDIINFPDDMCEIDEINLDMFFLEELNDPSNFIASITSTRTEDDILDMNDLYYRLDWACVNASLSGAQVEGLNHRVVYLRHFVLNWLINYSNQDWDNVTCDT